MVSGSCGLLHLNYGSFFDRFSERKSKIHLVSFLSASIRKRFFVHLLFLQLDAWTDPAGAVLFQCDNSGVERPVRKNVTFFN